MQTGFEKRFNQGDIVYWCHNTNGYYVVKYGMVDEQFSDAVVIDYLVPRERRLVNGIPIDKFESETKYKKLPKDWTWSTKLYQMTYSDLSDEEKEFIFDISKSEILKEAYEKGYLVKDSTIFHGIIEDEITNQGYRIVKKYPMWKHHIDHVSIRPDKVYFTYEVALEEAEKLNKEILRQTRLTDYEWSVEQIEKTLWRWKALSGASEEEMNIYKQWLLNLDNVDDIETRIFGGQIQWKYADKKRWNYIEL